jgi:hypothetical protein
VITPEDARQQAHDWINGGKSKAQQVEVGMMEFDLGYVVWAIELPPMDLSSPPATIGTATGVIDKMTGELTVVPSLPPEIVIEEYLARHRPGHQQLRASACRAWTPGSAAVVEGHLVAVGVRERESAAERPVDGR